jgi:hypothetical protein
MAISQVEYVPQPNRDEARGRRLPATYWALGYVNKWTLKNKAGGPLSSPC